MRAPRRISYRIDSRTAKEKNSLTSNERSRREQEDATCVLRVMSPSTPNTTYQLRDTAGGREAMSYWHACFVLRAIGTSGGPTRRT